MGSAEALQMRLRADLKAAMRDKREREKSALRALIAAIDDAQAVPVEQDQKYEVRPFGDPSVEVPRLALNGTALAELLAREKRDRQQAAAQMRALGETERAHLLEDEARIIAAYMQQG